MFRVYCWLWWHRELRIYQTTKNNFRYSRLYLGRRVLCVFIQFLATVFYTLIDWFLLTHVIALTPPLCDIADTAQSPGRLEVYQSGRTSGMTGLGLVIRDDWTGISDQGWLDQNHQRFKSISNIFHYILIMSLKCNQSNMDMLSLATVYKRIKTLKLARFELDWSQISLPSFLQSVW